MKGRKNQGEKQYNWKKLRSKEVMDQAGVVEDEEWKGEIENAGRERGRNKKENGKEENDGREEKGRREGGGKKGREEKGKEVKEKKGEMRGKRD